MWFVLKTGYNKTKAQEMRGHGCWGGSKAWCQGSSKIHHRQDLGWALYPLKLRLLTYNMEHVEGHFHGGYEL
jgi:hypothetical protein